MLIIGVFMIKFITYTIGIFMVSFSLLFMIIDLTLLNMGYNLSEYVNTIIDKKYLFIFIIGIILLFISIYRKGNKNDIYL